ncbi:TetR family transcriptional regulator C-terminal domain-containing protein [Amycolatopsis sp. cmx-4-68]|uniref:TetR family transcriptional regulator C-terminal domain-containing protein n=1 Tax=Amycolatopsis sp. cmx-4-68 TaxID=2790938 RepID=UPI00397C31AE
MPKQIDHDRRRAQIAEATWRLIAKRGIEAATMREITAALGMAHGALKHYFPDKNAIVKAAFTHVFEATNTRIGERLGEVTGLAGLRVFCREVLPADEVTELEARVVLPFWQRALADAELESVFAAAMTEWRSRMAGFLRAAREDGSVTSPVADEVLVEQLLTMLNGTQVHALLTPKVTTARLQWRMVEAFIESLGPQPARTASAPRRAGVAEAATAAEQTDAVAAEDFLSFSRTAVDVTAGRLPGTDREAMAMVLLLHRVANTVVYDLESTVHRPAGWSWSAFRLLFTVWVAGPQEASRAAELTGMSRAAVSSLAKTLATAGLVGRAPDERDRRSVVLSLTDTGRRRLEATFRAHNQREARWADLLAPADLRVLNRVLADLARAAQDQGWVSHRF